MEGSEQFDPGAATAPLSREAPYASSQEPYGGAHEYGYGRPPSMYGYRRPFAGPRLVRGFGGQGRQSSETKPFFLTSEFLVTLLAIVALGITAGVMDIVDARLTWILTAAMVFGYVMSRGLAKAGSQSRSFDPREELLARLGGDGNREDRQTTHQPAVEHGMSGPRQPLETKPFFLTSEFVGTLLAVIAVALTAAAMDNLGARLTWILISAMVFTYALSRGIAKAGTRSYSLDPREDLLRRGPAAREQGHEAAPPATSRMLHAVETKPFLVTSEFIGTLLAIVAIAISGATIDVLDVRLTWILITAMVCGYVLSRGVAKIGVGSRSFDPREELLQRAFDSGTTQRQEAGHR